MKKFIYRSSSAMLLGIALIFSACNKEQETQRSAENHVKQEAEMEAAFEDTDQLVGSAVQQSENNERIEGLLEGDLCANATVSFNAEAKSIIIDFGSGCTSPRGVERKGKVIISFTGRYGQNGTVISTSFDNYSVNGIQIEGTRTLTNKGFSNNGITFEVKVINGKLTWPDGSSATINLNHDRTWIFNNENRIEFRISGSASGINRNGENFSSAITEPLVFTLDCVMQQINIPTKGIKKVTVGERPELTINYGDGTCDKTINLSNENRSWSITVD